MLREESLQEISDGKLYRSSDLVRADSRGCAGCHKCCTGMGDSVVLDPMDVMRLSRTLGKAPGELIGKEIELGMHDGNILPHLAMRGKEEACSFLSAEGRCSIHPARPGFCRMFPLGRFYEDRKFSYILQVHECPAPHRSKIRVSKWLDMPDLVKYEAFVLDWHNLLLDIRELLAGDIQEDQRKQINLLVLSRFYLTPFDSDVDFYEQYEIRRRGLDILFQGEEQ